MAREVKPREYWIHCSIELPENEELRQEGKPVVEHGLGSGGLYAMHHYNGEWLTDEEIDQLAAQQTKFLARYIKDMRDREIARAQEAAKPFWQRWLGA